MRIWILLSMDVLMGTVVRVDDAERVCKVAGIAVLHPLKFRHGLAVHLLQQGVPIPVISACFGHAFVYMTMQMYMKVSRKFRPRWSRACSRGESARIL